MGLVGIRRRAARIRHRRRRHVPADRRRPRRCRAPCRSARRGMRPGSRAPADDRRRPCAGPHRRRCPARPASARPSAVDSAMVQRVPVASVSSAARLRGQVARRLRLRPQLDHRRGEAHQVDRVHQMRVQHRLALLGHQRGDIAETGQARAGRAVAAQRPPAPPPATAAHRRHRPAEAAAVRAGAGAGAAAGSRRTRSPGVGRSATWHRRISTISAAARRSGAVSTSPTPFSSICQARASDRHATAGRPAPRRACAPPRAVPGCRAAPGTDFSRVRVWSQLQQVLQQHAEIGAALVRPVGDRQRLAAAARPSPPPSGRTPAPRSARPSMSTTGRRR